MAILVLAALFLLASGQTKFLGPVLFFSLPVLVPAALVGYLLFGGSKK